MCILECNQKEKFLCDGNCQNRIQLCNFKSDCLSNVDEGHCNFCPKIKNIKNFECRIIVDYKGRLLHKPEYPYHELDYCLSYNCSSEEYKCYNEGFCLSIDLVCDGINHCLLGDDEFNCKNFTPKGFFKCRDQNKYLSHDKICNGIVDCQHGSDELTCQKEKTNITFKNRNNYCKNHSKTFPVFVACIAPKKNDIQLTLDDYQRIKTLMLIGSITLKNSFESLNLNVLIIRNNKNFNIDSFKKIPNIFMLEIIASSPLKEERNVLFENQSFLLLQKINLSRSDFFSLRFIENIQCKNLRFLIISHTKISSLKKSNFLYLTNLIYFEMDGLSIKLLEKNSFTKLKNLKTLIMRSTFIPLDYSSMMIKSLKNLNYMNCEQFQLCCFVEKYLTESIFCKPKATAFRTCKSIIPNLIFKILFWLAGIFGTFLNLLSAYLLLNKQKKDGKIFQFSITFSDTLSSFFFIVLCSFDSYYGPETYLENEDKWRKSITCKTLGVTMSFSILFSLISILMLTLEKFISISIPLERNNILFNLRKFFVIFPIICLILATLPLFLYSVRNSFNIKSLLMINPL